MLYAETVIESLHIRGPINVRIYVNVSVYMYESALFGDPQMSHGALESYEGSARRRRICSR
jgi:hypothetical protein